VEELNYLYYTVDEKPIAAGWRWSLVLITPPLPCPYGSLPINIELNYDPEDPTSPPMIWFKNQVYHPMVDGDHFMIPDFYFRIKGNISLTNIVENIYQAFLDPYSSVPSYTLEKIERLWAEHDPRCTCSLFSIPYVKIKELPEDTRNKHYQRVMDLLNKRGSGIVDNYIEQVKVFRDIKKNYKPIHPELFSLYEMSSKNWFVPSFSEALSKGTPEAFKAILKEEIPEVYTFDIFTPQFCKFLAQEVKNFEDSPFPKSRPNSMNNYGVILNNIGMEPIFDKLLEIIKPLTAILYPSWGGNSIDHHHTFIVQYKMGKDLSLDMHTDDSEVTLNVNISDEFEGAPLNFCGFFGKKDQRKHSLTYIHQKGKAIIHAGRHRHGAAEITDGERYNLIVWFKSSTFRQEHDHDYSRKDLEITPDEVCLSKTHDPDFMEWKHTFSHHNHH